jgi:hypothetical protein
MMLEVSLIVPPPPCGPPEAGVPGLVTETNGAGGSDGRGGDQGLLPPTLEPAGHDPKQIVGRSEFRSLMPAFHDRQLLAEGEVLRHEAPTPVEKAKKSAQEQLNEHTRAL